MKAEESVYSVDKHYERRVYRASLLARLAAWSLVVAGLTLPVTMLWADRENGGLWCIAVVSLPISVAGLALRVRLARAFVLICPNGIAFRYGRTRARVPWRRFESFWSSGADWQIETTDHRIYIVPRVFQRFEELHYALTKASVYAAFARGKRRALDEKDDEDGDGRDRDGRDRDSPAF